MSIKSMAEIEQYGFGKSISQTDDVEFLSSYDYEERSIKNGNTTFMYNMPVYLEKLSGQSVVNFNSKKDKDFTPFYFDGPVMINAGVRFNFTPLTSDFLYCIYYKSSSEELATLKNTPVTVNEPKIKCKNVVLTSYKKMPEGLCFRPEKQPFWELTYLVKGNYVRTINGVSWNIGGECYTFIPPNQLHSLKTDSGEAEFMAIMFEMDCPDMEKLIPPREVTPSIKYYLDVIKSKIGDDSQYAEDMILNLISLIVAETLSGEYDIVEESKSSVVSIVQMNEVVARADRLIDENIFNPILSVSFIAKKLFISTSYLYRCSMHKYNVGISEHINDRKLEMACELIANGNYSLSEISSNLNFCSQSYFATRFKKKYGMSPLQYSRHINKN